VRRAARGRRDMDTGSEPIGGQAELTQVRRQARAVHLKTFFAAFAVTLLFMFVV
jgi:hypothetical protein